MPRKARASSSGSFTILMDRTRSATAGELWRCRISGFKQPFYGRTPLAAVQQIGQFVQSELEHRLQIAAGAGAGAKTRTRQATVRTRTKTRTRRSQQPQMVSEEIL